MKPTYAPFPPNARWTSETAFAELLLSRACDFLDTFGLGAECPRLADGWARTSPTSFAFLSQGAGTIHVEIDVDGDDQGKERIVIREVRFVSDRRAVMEAATRA